MLDTIEDQMTVIYCFMDDFFHAQPVGAEVSVVGGRRAANTKS